MRASVWLAGIALFSTVATAERPVCAESADANAPRVFQYSGASLAAARGRVQAGDPSMAPVLKALRERGDALLSDGPFTIVHKQHPLPGVDPHDYVSLAPYYWPNPDTSNHLPYIRRDGERNPETREFDARIFSAFSEHVWGLALAGYMTGDERYSRRAAVLLRAWFLDPETRMNPNLDHGQFVKGENTGRGTGIIESNRFLNVIDGVGLLRATSAGWTADDQSKLEDWFRAYLKWMQESPNGKAEAAATNNHGTWYDVQVATYMLFVGDEAGAASRRSGQEQTHRCANPTRRPNARASRAAPNPGVTVASISKRSHNWPILASASTSISGITRRPTAARSAPPWTSTYRSPPAKGPGPTSKSPASTRKSCFSRSAARRSR